MSRLLLVLALASAAIAGTARADSDSRPAGISADEVKARDEVAALVDASLAATRLGDCARATEAMKKVVAQTKVVLDHMKPFAAKKHTPEETAWLERHAAARYSGGGKARPRRGKLAPECVQSDAYKAAVADMPKDLAVAMAFLTQLAPPESVTDAMLAVADRFDARMAQVREAFAKASDCKSKAAVVVAQTDASAAKLADELDVFKNDDDTKRWFAQKYTLTNLALVSKDTCSELTTALAKFPLARGWNLPSKKP